MLKAIGASGSGNGHAGTVEGSRGLASRGAREETHPHLAPTKQSHDVVSDAHQCTPQSWASVSA